GGSLGNPLYHPGVCGHHSPPLRRGALRLVEHRRGDAVAEEIFKLLPLFVYLWLSRRATALSLSDYALIGAAVGGGFQMMEEVARRLASGEIWGYGFSIWDGQVIHWEFFDLFPGYFESSYFATEMMSGHAVITSLTALGVGLGIRWRRKGGR